MKDDLPPIARNPIECWNVLSTETKTAMKELGNFSITYDGDNIKGYGTFGDDEPGKVYWNAKDLKRYAKALLEVADILG